MAKSSRPVSNSREPERGWVVCEPAGRTRLRYCCRSMSDVGSPSMMVRPATPRLGRPSAPGDTLAAREFAEPIAGREVSAVGVVCAIDDAVGRLLPNERRRPSRAESWTESRDGLVYGCNLRRGRKFDNGDPVSAEDVKFSFD